MSVLLTAIERSDTLGHIHEDCCLLSGLLCYIVNSLDSLVSGTHHGPERNFSTVHVPLFRGISVLVSIREALPHDISAENYADDRENNLPPRRKRIKDFF